MMEILAGPHGTALVSYAPSVILALNTSWLPTSDGRVNTPLGNACPQTVIIPSIVRVGLVHGVPASVVRATTTAGISREIRRTTWDISAPRAAAALAWVSHGIAPAGSCWE